MLRDTPIVFDDEYHYLVIDPSPLLTEDSHRWTALFYTVPVEIKDLDTMWQLSTLFWTMRFFGVTLRRDATGFKFNPVFTPESYWQNVADWDEWIALYARPYLPEINKCLSSILYKVV